MPTSGGKRVPHNPYRRENPSVAVATDIIGSEGAMRRHRDDSRIPASEPRLAGSSCGLPIGVCKLHVQQVPFSADEKELRQTLSEEFGEIIDAWLARGCSGKHRGFGNVTFATFNAAERALAAGTVQMHGRAVQILRSSSASQHAPPVAEREPPAQRRRLDADGSPGRAEQTDVEPPEVGDANAGISTRRAALAKLSVDELMALLRQ